MIRIQPLMIECVATDRDHLRAMLRVEEIYWLRTLIGWYFADGTSV